MASVSEQLAEQFQSLKKESNLFFKLVEELQKLEKDKQKNFALIKEKIDQLLCFLEKDNAFLKKSPIFKIDKKQQAELNRLKQECESIEKKYITQFTLELEQCLKIHDLKMEGNVSSNLRAGFFMFELDLNKSKVVIWYGIKQERLGETTAISAEELIKKVDDFSKNLGSGLDGETFIKHLKNILHHRKTKPIPIIDVLLQMALLIQNDKFKLNPLKEHYRSYSRADFSYDLFRYRELLVKEKLKLTTAVRQYTDHTKEHLWIPINHTSLEGTCYSHLDISTSEENNLLYETTYS